MTFWQGCHGVRLTESALDVGRSQGTPLRDAIVAVGPMAPPVGEPLWEIRQEVSTPRGVATVEQWLYQRPEGTFVVMSTSGHAVSVDPESGAISVDGRDDGVRLLRLTTFGLPLVLLDSPVLVVHASACFRDGGAVLISGESGRGKSSALVGLVDAGWQAVSEDLCVVDLRNDPPLVWPGPPWVRRSPGLDGPAGARVRFTMPDKVAWDLELQLVDGPVPIREIVFLEPPGGAVVDRASLGVSEVVQRLARHALWLGHPDDRGRKLFGPTVEVAGSAPASALRIPVNDSWLELLVGALG